MTRAPRIASRRPVGELISDNVVNTLVLVLPRRRRDDPGRLRHRDGLGQLPPSSRRHGHPDGAAHAGGPAGVRDRHPAGGPVLHHRVPLAARGHASPRPASTRGTPRRRWSCRSRRWCSRSRRTSPGSCARTLLEVLDSDYVELARLKGIPESVVMRKHALLNAIVPGIQVIALQLAWLAGGVVVVEIALQLPRHRLPARRLGPQPRRADGAGAQHDHRRRLRRGEPGRRPPLDPAHPPRADGDQLMSGPRPPAAHVRRRACRQKRLVVGLVITVARGAVRGPRPPAGAARRERGRRARRSAPRRSSAPTTSARTSCPG